MNAEFVDTNVLVYAYDHSAGGKRRAALELLERLTSDSRTAVSTQVMVELFSTMTGKLAHDSVEVEAILRSMSGWQTHRPALDDIIAAARLQRRFQLSWWDALIVTSAQALGCDVLWTEDLTHGQRFGTVTVRSPFQ